MSQGVTQKSEREPGNNEITKISYQAGEHDRVLKQRQQQAQNKRTTIQQGDDPLRALLGGQS